VADKRERSMGRRQVVRRRWSLVWRRQGGSRTALVCHLDQAGELHHRGKGGERGGAAIGPNGR
jgi:muconolactone delta-isomerase